MDCIYSLGNIRERILLLYFNPLGTIQTNTWDIMNDLWVESSGRLLFVSYVMNLLYNSKMQLNINIDKSLMWFSIWQLSWHGARCYLAGVFCQYKKLIISSQNTAVFLVFSSSIVNFTLCRESIIWSVTFSLIFWM